MNAQELYKKMDVDFETDRFTDEWPADGFGDYVSENFRKRMMGVVLDNAAEIERIYTAVFPTDEIIEKILQANETNVLLFTHHPQVWDLRLAGFPFKNFSSDKLEKMKARKISLYALHVPLDNNGEYSTSVSFARALGIQKEKDFAPYGGGMAGVIGQTELETVSELAERTSAAVGHGVKVFNYGSDNINNQEVAMVAGGGNDREILAEVAQKGINAYVTGVAAVTSYPPSIEFHKFAKANKINVISATHYSTEQFACMAMCRYFEKSGLPCEFLADEPDMLNLG